MASAQLLFEIFLSGNSTLRFLVSGSRRRKQTTAGFLVVAKDVRARQRTRGCALRGRLVVRWGGPQCNAMPEKRPTNRIVKVHRLLG
eukprot:Skav219816  [mRNA]  locus=scaffold147:370270:376089:+ [translate_table: standard]